MSRRMLVLGFLVLAVCPALGLRGWQSSELHFSAEDDAVRHPVPIPHDVWLLLSQDSDVHEVMQNQNPPLDVPPGTWFSAAAISLHTTNGHDLVVQGEGQMMGANVTLFWVFAETHEKWKMVLKIPAHDLVLQSNESGGYKVIEASTVVAGHASTLTYKFNGGRYIASSRK